MKNIYLLGATGSIGKQTIEVFEQYLKESKSIIWNGPVGMFEEEKYSVSYQEYIIALRFLRICNGCFEDLDTAEVLEYIGGSLKTASDDDIDDGSDEAYERYRDEQLFGD